MKRSTTFSPLRLAACVMCTVAIAAMTNPAEARPRHHAKHHVSHHHGHKHHHAGRHHVRVRKARHSARWSAFRAKAQQFGDSNASMDSSGGFGGGFSSGSSVVAAARSYIGRGNPTGRSSLWCARFMNMVLQKTGHKGTGSDMASSFARYGQRVSGPQVGAIAVMSRGRRGGHVGVVSGIDAKGNPIIISGNHGHRVAEATYSRGRIYAYVMPNS